MLDEVAAHRVVVTCEDGVRDGGIGMAISDAVRQRNEATHVEVLGLPTSFIAQGKPEQILAAHGLDAAGIAAAATRHI